MRIKNLIDEDFANYKKCSMFIGFPTCTFKCCKEAGCNICQNSALAKSPTKDIPASSLLKRYVDNPLSEAIVCGGLEPFDSFDDLFMLLIIFRKANVNDTFVIYTGYKEDEIEDKIKLLSKYPNVIIKFGRFIPNSQHRKDEILGVELASDNQYAKQIS